LSVGFQHLLHLKSKTVSILVKVIFLLSKYVGFYVLLFLRVTQGHFSDHSSSESGMVILEGESDVLSTVTSEESNFEADKKTDEMTGDLSSLHKMK